MRKLWTRTLEATMLGFLLAAILLCVTLLMTMQGCVAASWDSETTEELEPARIVTTIDPVTGKEHSERVPARMKTSRKRANYTDNRAAGAMAAGALDQLGGMGGVLSAIPGGGLVGAGVAILGGLGLIHKNGTKAAELQGREHGYATAQVELGAGTASTKGVTQ